MTDEATAAAKSRDRIADIVLDPKSVARANVNVEHEREVAIFDILDGNSFAVAGEDRGPYKLNLALVDDKLVLIIASQNGDPVAEHAIPLTPLKRIMKDYFLVCESYYEAVRTAPPSRIQAIDVNRRSLHDEGSVMLRDKLSGRVDIDAGTSRRLFTLVCALHWKG